jgi:hypothetical protein
MKPDTRQFLLRVGTLDYSYPVADHSKKNLTATDSAESIFKAGT